MTYFSFMVCVLCVLFFLIIYFELIFSLSFFLFCFLEMSVLGFSCLDHNFCTQREARTQSLLPSPPGLLPERVPLGPRDPLVSPRRTDSETRSCRLPCSTWPRAHSPSRTSLPSGACPAPRGHVTPSVQTQRLYRCDGLPPRTGWQPREGPLHLPLGS